MMKLLTDSSLFTKIDVHFLSWLKVIEVPFDLRDEHWTLGYSLLLVMLALFFFIPRKDTTPPKNGNLLTRSTTSIGRFSLRAQTERNPSIICFFMALSNKKGEPEVTAEKLGSLFKERVISRHFRFGCRINKQDDRLFEIIDNPDMDIFVEGPEQVNHQDLEGRIDHFMTEKMDVDNGLWQVQISSGPLGSSGAIPKERLERLKSTAAATTESILLFRVHHVLCDGPSMSVAIGDLCDDAAKLRSVAQSFIDKQKEKKANRTFVIKVRDAINKFLYYTIGSIVALSLQFWRDVAAINPFDRVPQTDSSEPVERSTAWRRMATVDEIKQVGKKISHFATINDVMVYCITAALHRQLLEHQQAMRQSGSDLYIPKSLNVVVPVHLMGGILPRGQSVGNGIGAFVSSIPVGGDKNSGASSKMRLVSKALLAGKRSPAYLIAWMMAKVVSDWAPIKLAKMMFRYGNGHSVATITNVKGFPFQTHLNGHPFETVVAFVPLPPGIPIGATIQSFDGEILFSLQAEKHAIPDAAKFTDWVEEEYQNLKREASSY